MPRERQSARRVLRPALTVIITVLVAVALLRAGGMGARLTGPAPTLPRLSCHAQPAVGPGPFTVPLEAEPEAAGEALIAPVCINGQGPFPMLVDSGASATAVTAALARRLDLPPAGSRQRFYGVGCALEGQPVRLGSWSIGNVALASQTAYSESLDVGTGPSAVEGLLGSDVLSRFGAVRLDYARRQAVVPGPEGPVQNHAGVVRGPTGPGLPPSLARYHPRAVLPIDVVEMNDQSEAAVRVTINGHPAVFVLDTGAAISSVTLGEASGLGLQAAGKKIKVTGAGCSSGVQVERVAHWSLPGVALAPQYLAAVSLPGASGAGTATGLLGSDVLVQCRAVTIDFAGGRLALDARPPLPG